MRSWLNTLIVISCLTGCGGSGNQSTAQQNPAKKSAEKSANKQTKKQAAKEDTDDEEFKIIKPDNPAAVENLRDIAKDVTLDGSEHVVKVVLGKLEVDRQVRYIRDLKYIQALEFTGDDVTDKHLQAISKLSDLKKLVLNDVNVSDAGMQHLAAFGQLEELHLPSAKVGDEGVKSIARLKQLKVLDLMYTDISDASLESLAKLDKLEKLDISFTKISKLPLSTLERWGSMRSLSLRFTDIEEDAVHAIRKRRPALVVNGLSGESLARNERQAKGDQPLAPAALAVGVEVPDIEGEDFTGKVFKLSDYRGKVVALDFWGYWCPACVTELPRLKQTVENMKSKQQPFVLLGINSDSSKQDTVTRMTKEKVSWRSWYDGSGGPIARRWNVTAWPTTYVIDHQGVIRYKNVRGKALVEAVQTLLKEMSQKAKPTEKKKSQSKAKGT